jgi:hypothetical protein
MAITVKTIGGREYVYYAYRRGNKVVQEYLGPRKDPAVAAKIAGNGQKRSLPQQLRRLFWDVDPGTIDVRLHSRYIIERILEVGDLEAVRWAQRRYPTAMIIETLRMSRRLSDRSRAFWRIWFGDAVAP